MFESWELHQQIDHRRDQDGVTDVFAIVDGSGALSRKNGARVKFSGPTGTDHAMPTMAMRRIGLL
jgi:hypothetical protein